jgi:hypothetical protein
MTASTADPPHRGILPVPMDPVGEALWAKVLEDWEDDARHAAFIAHCQMSQGLGLAAARYRVVVEGGDGYRALANRGEDAKKRLAGVTTLALMVMQSTATTPEEVKRPARWVAALVVLFACLAGAVLVRAFR